MFEKGVRIRLGGGGGRVKSGAKTPDKEEKVKKRVKDSDVECYKRENGQMNISLV